MFNSLYLDCLNSAEQNSIQENVMKLFENSTDSVKAEREMDEHINAIVKNFLRTINSSSDIEISELIENFTNSKFPSKTVNNKTYVNKLYEQVVTHSIHTSSPRFIGHMNAALPYFVRPIAKLMTAMNQNLVKTETAKALTPYQRQVLAKIHRLIYDFPEEFYSQHIQNPQSTLGIIVSGGTIANITALWCARNASLGPKDGFTGVTNEGLAAALNCYGYNGAVVIGSSLIHYSFEKAADLLGIGAHGLIKVPANHKNQIDLQALRQTIRKCRAQNQHIIAIIGVAGTTDSGGVDSLSDIAHISQEANVHFHVDAAWGGPVIFSQKHRHKLAGLEKADSVTIDGHKQMYLPMGIGMLFLRDPKKAEVIEKQAPYAVRKKSVDLGKRALEGSCPSTVLLLDAGLNLIGVKGYEFLINEGIRKTQYLANCISAMPEFELLAEPDLNILIYRYIPDSLKENATKGKLTKIENEFLNRFNHQLQKDQRHAGRTFVSRTTTNTTRYGQDIPLVALRSVIANPLTTEDDIDAVLNDQIKIATEIVIR
ncbi:MAG: aminotransferase class V-fold PLP-dependent enzyme [Nostoc sp. DedSLP03]|uniref:aminotransferase class V-fold PLP-dependent enzyme n=1 Tax=Nostoc sp. DedSLP03 TaxID=3075400 RepID=UPI002AD367F8|nr:aminotransferase class V-fold PLP-dependent enzyme [Nostoc sp. DedSLP03]MDZ7965825.1 aminotransferase class V-fold PLP-dependent enzyme [Nostoc sp. DedSLP03]